VRKSKRDALQISERQLTAMTEDLTEMHQATLPALREHVAGMINQLNEVRPSRRGFLIGSGATVGVLALAACGKSDKASTAATTGTTAASGSGQLSGDLQIAAMAASLENLGVSTYRAGIAAATAGKLGTVPPAVVTFAQTAMMQHTDHAAAWNAVVASTGHAKITQDDPAVKPTVDQMFSQVTDVPGLLKLALAVENIAAATYLNGIGVIQNKDALKTAASIHPVEMQHAAILNFVLGQYPVPDTFAKTDGARPPGDYQG